MASSSVTTLFLLLLLLPSTSFAAATSSSTSLQKLLHSHGLPVQLDEPCLAKFESRVFFESVVRANLSFGGLIGFEGLSQEELFLWFPVKGIFVNDPDSGVILMDIGLAHKQLSVSLFEDPPSCKPDGKGGFFFHLFALWLNLLTRVELEFAGGMKESRGMKGFGAER
ncbi:hypothetical protein LINPERPRIM_LOCUS34005 [Linum perenne]